VVRVLAQLMLNAGAFWLATALYPRALQLGGARTALVAGLVLGVVNLAVRPVLLVLTLPLRLVTLGVATLLVNALMLYLVAWLVGLRHGGLPDMVVLAALVSLFSLALNRMVGA